MSVHHVTTADQSATRQGQLALAFQEVLTAVARLKSNRQTPPSADSYRRQLKKLLDDANRRAAGGSCAAHDLKAAVYAVVVLIDEVVLTSGSALAPGWRPLQVEIFGDQVGGERFFELLKALSGREETAELADVLEVFQLCLLLGFEGRYAGARQDELRAIISSTAEKIQRVRGGHGALSPRADLPRGETIAVSRDPWLWRLTIGLGGAFVVTLILLLVFKVLLSADTAAFEAEVSRLTR